MRRSAATCRSIRASIAVRGQPGQVRGRRAPARAARRQRDPRLAPGRLRARPGPLQPALPAAGDGRLPRPAGRRPATTLEREANGVSDNPAGVRPDDGPAILSGGNFHGEPVAFAADQIALALAEIGSLAERRIALLTDPRSQRPAGVPDARRPGLNSGFMLAQIAAAALASENQHLAHPVAIDSRPTSANQEDHVSMATYAARRLLEMADNAAAHRRDRAARRRPGHRAAPAAPDQPRAGGRRSPKVRHHGAFLDRRPPAAREIGALAAVILAGGFARTTPSPDATGTG